MRPRFHALAVFAMGVMATGITVAAGSAPSTDVQTLAEQNQRLEQQVRAQQKTIDELASKMGELLRATERQERELRGLQEQMGSGGTAPQPSFDRAHEVRIGAEAGLAFFRSGAEGQFPKSEFRVDDAFVTIEAPVWKNTYFFGELKLLTRESPSEGFSIGELYVDFEDISALWGKPGWLSFRAGRINTPFGEEYQMRGPISNPLISHSLSDIWGTDEGAEIYGSLGPVR